MSTPPTSTTAPSKSWRSAISGNVLMMGLVSLFTDFSSEMINPILPVFFAGLVGGVEAAVWVGFAEGIAEFTASLLKIFSGRISDGLGKRKALVIVGYGLSSICRPAISLVAGGIAGATQVVGLKFGDRVGKGIRTSPRDALIGDSVDPGSRGVAFSFHRMMDHTGAILGPLAVIAILWGGYGMPMFAKASAKADVPASEMQAMRVLFAVALVPGILAMLALVLKVREIAPNAAIGSQKVLAGGVWKALPKKFYAFVGIVSLFALGNSSDMFLLLYAWDLFGMGLNELVLLWIVLHLSKVVFSLPGGILSDRIGRRPIIITGWAMYALVYLGFAWAGHLAEAGRGAAWQFWALFIAYGFYFGMAEGAEKALVADFISSEHRGTAFGIYHGAIGIAALPANAIFGIFWLAIGPERAFGIGAALAGLAAVLLIFLLSTTRKKEATA